MQVKILKDYKQYKKGDLVDVKRDTANLLIHKGFAIAHKMMTTGATN